MKDEIKEFAKAHRKEILAWQKWLRKQDGKTISEIDWESEPKLIITLGERKKKDKK